MAGSELALSLLAYAAVAATLLGLLVSLQRMSRHPALAGAVTYGVGHLAYSLGSSVYSVMNAGPSTPSELLGAPFPNLTDLPSAPLAPFEPLDPFVPLEPAGPAAPALPVIEVPLSHDPLDLM
jgi:hypothetical protein